MKKRLLPQCQDESPRRMGPCVRRDDSLKRHAYENSICDSLAPQAGEGEERKRPAMSRPLSRIMIARERQTAAVIHCCSFCFGAAPTWREAISPPLKIIRVGIDITPYFEAVFGLSSTFSLTILTLSPIAPEISSSAGAIMRQGPHHSAQKSTTTGPVALSTSASKSASETLPTAIAVPRSVWKDAAFRNRRLDHVANL